MTVHDALQWARKTLATSSDAPALDATRLLGHVLKQNNAWLHTHDEEKLTPSQETDFRAFVDERHTGRPLAYVLGTWDFYGRTFIVTPDVLVPRPATEELVEQAIVAIRALAAEKSRPVTIADIGTGSGCIIVTLACELANFQFPSAGWRTNFQFIAIDISRPALRVAKKNAQRYHVADRIEFLHGNMLEPLANKPVDLIVSNPPYVPTGDLAAAGHATDTRGLTFEPRLALDGGSDGERYTAALTNTSVPMLLEAAGGVVVSHNI